MSQSRQIFKKIQSLTVPKTTEYIFNRNPLNLENINAAYKVEGYHLERPDKLYNYRLDVTSTGRYVVAKVKHFQSGDIIKVSTSDWILKEQLYRTQDTVAFINLGQVLANRCLQFGIKEMSYSFKVTKNGKLEKLLNILSNEGITMTNPNKPYIS